MKPKRAIPRPRFAGVLVTAAMLSTVVIIWRATEPATDGPPPAPAHGGRLTAAIREAPQSMNGLVAADEGSELLSFLTQGPLVRVNRATFELEPWLAERWESSADGRVHTLHLRRDVAWSDGTPFSSADVLFTIEAVFDPKTTSVLSGRLQVARMPIRASAPDAQTVVLTYERPSGEGVRLLDRLPIYPKHKLEAALAAGTLADAWRPGTPLAEMVGTGPFVLREHQAGSRLVLDRNPRYWRKTPEGEPLPYLDELVLEIVPDGEAALRRLEAGEIDLIEGAVPHEQFAAARRAEREGRIRMVELGVSPVADALWFCLSPAAKKGDPRFEFVRRAQFRQAISHAVDREAFARTVFEGEAVPVWGPVTPGDAAWFSPNVPRYPPNIDLARALLKEIGLEDRDGNGVVEDAKGIEARFTVHTERGTGASGAGATAVREAAAAIGIALEVAAVDGGEVAKRIASCDYDAIYGRAPISDPDPAGNLGFWLSSGSGHVWNPGQRMPATEWETRIDTLMFEQVATTDPARRKELFDHVQRIMGEEVPMLYFAAPRLYAAHGRGVAGVAESVRRPPVLWNGDLVGLTAGRR